MKKIANEDIFKNMSEEEKIFAITDGVTSIFNEIKAIDSSYPQEHHEDMIQKVVSSIAFDVDLDMPNLDDVFDNINTDSIDKLSEDLSKIVDISKKIAEKNPLMDELLYKTLISEEDVSKEDLSGFEEKNKKSILSPIDEMEVEFHPDYAHRHLREDGSIDVHIDGGYIEKQEHLNNSFLKIAKPARFAEHMTGCWGRSREIALILTLSKCLYDKTKDDLKEDLDKLFKKLSKKGAKGRPIKSLVKSRPSIADKSISRLTLSAQDLFGFLSQYKTYVISAYLTYKFIFASSIIDIALIIGGSQALQDVAVELGFALTLSLTGGWLIGIPKYLYQLRKYSKLINKSCKQLYKAQSFIRKNGIASRLKNMKQYEKCLANSAASLSLSPSEAEKIMKKADFENFNIIKTSLNKLMNFLEKNNFSEKNDLKLIMKEV